MIAGLSHRRIALSLAGLGCGTAGGAIFAWAGTPIPWLLGSLLTAAAVNLLGWRVACPPGGRQLGQVFIGAVIGLYFTPAVAVAVIAHFPWMILTAAVSIAIGGLGAVLLARIAGLDAGTALLAGVPGGMAEMINIAERFGASPVPLAVSQLIRVTIILLTVPALLTYLGGSGTDSFVPAIREVDAPMLGVLLAACVAVALVLNRLGMTNAWMLGSCLFVAVLTLAEIHLSAIPGYLLTAAQVLIGTSVGQRFERAAMAGAPWVVLGSAVTTVVLMAAAAGMAALVAAATGISIWSMLAATAPGGLAEMSVTAQLLGLGVPLVTAYHVTRIIMITLLAPTAFRVAARIAGRSGG